jgi:hypothetical protein
MGSLMPAPSALDRCCAALAASARENRRRRIRALAIQYDRARALRALLPALCDRPPDPMRELHPRWLRDDAATARLLMHALVAAINSALWDRAHGRGDRTVRELRIDALRTALEGERLALRRLKAAHRAAA